MSAHAYTEDQLVEQPAARGKAEGEMLKAEMPSKSITAAGDELNGFTFSLTQTLSPRRGHSHSPRLWK
jgi:hypothetical protein